MMGHISSECWNWGLGITTSTVEVAQLSILNSYQVLVDVCNECNSLNCACDYDTSVVRNSTSILSSEHLNIISDSSKQYVDPSRRSNSSFVRHTADLRNSIGSSSHYHLQPKDVFSNHSDSLNFNLSAKCFNFGHLNVQGLCGQNMSKFSQLKALLSSPVNNALHLIGLSETKLKEHTTNFFRVNGFQMSFRINDNISNGGGGIMVYVKNGINAIKT